MKKVSENDNFVEVGKNEIDDDLKEEIKEFEEENDCEWTLNSIHKE